MRKLYYSLFLVLLGSTSYGQFGSNACSAGPLPIQCAPNTVNLTSSYTNSGVTNPYVANGTGCSSVGSDITAGTIYDYDGWFTTTADASGLVEVYAAIISGDPVIGLYSGTCSSPVLLSCDDDGGSGLDAYISQSGLTPGATYWVRIWDYNGGTGTYEVTTNGGTPPANDDCSNASGVTVNGSAVSGTTYCATVETTDWNDCESNTENNVWFTFTTTYDGDITVNFSSVDCFGSGAGIDVSVFYGNCSSFTSYGCTSVSAGGSGNITQFSGPAGTYYVMVDGDNSGGATALCDFDVDVDFVADPCSVAGGVPPGNDDCANAVTLIENGAPVAGTVYCATVETSDWNDCESNTENNVWYTYTPSANGNVNVNVFPNNCFTSNDQLDVSIFSGNCSSMVFQACGSVGSTLNTISFNASSGTTYYIMVDGVNDGNSTSNCDFNIDVDFSATCPTPGYTDITNGGTLLSANNPYDCNSQFLVRADLIGAAGGVLAPGIIISVDGNTFDAYTNAEFSINCYQYINGSWQLVTNWPAGTFPNGPVATIFNLTNYFFDPTVPTMVEFCDSYGDGTVDYSISDAVTGAVVVSSSTADFDAVPGTGSSECIQVTIPANTLQPAASWTISPVPSNPNAFIDLNNGYAYVNTSYMMPGSYDITYIFDDGNGCYSTSTQTLIVGPAPPVAAFIDSLCGDASGNGVFDLTSYNSTVNTGNANSVYWYDNTITAIGTPTSYTVNTTGSPDTVYAVVQDATSSCLAASQNLLVVTESPTVVASPDPANVCAGQSLPINAVGSGGTGFLTYNWTGAGASNLDNTSNPSPTFTSSTTGTQTLTVTATDNVGCTATDAITLNVNPVPATPTITSTPPTCSADGSSTISNYSSGNTYTFTPTGPSVGAGGVISGMVVGTSYTVIADNGNCSSSASASFSNAAMLVTPTASASNNGPICEGNALTLTGGTNGLVSYSWSGPSSYSNGTQSPTVSSTATPSMSGVYTLTVSNGSCTNTATTTVVVNALPTATASNNGPVCEGATLSLTGGANGMSTYSWTGTSSYSNGTQSPTVSTSATTGMSGVYTLTVYDGNCSNTATTTVVVNPLPTATASNNGPICSGTSLTLTGGSNGMTSYSWSGPSSYSNGTQSPTVSTSATTAMSGVYTLTVNDGNCTNTATTTVVVNPLPTATASNSGPVCVGDQLDLTGGANGMTSYSWSGPSSYSNGTQSPTVSTSANTGMAGVYTLTVDDGTCSNTATTTVVVNALPTATASNNGPVCEGTALTLTGGTNGMISYSWSGPSSYTNGTQSPTVSSSATTSMSGVYTLTVNDGSCTNTATTTVQVNALPTVSASNNGSVCEGEQIDLTGGANGMTSYSWSGPSSYSNGTQSPTVSTSATTSMAGVYTLTVNDGNCSNSATTTLVVNTLPVASAGSAVVIDCNSPSGQMPLDGSGSDAGMNYSWVASSGGNIVSGGLTTTPQVDAAGTYTITVQNPTTGCFSTDNVTVTTDFATPTSTIAAPGQLDCSNPSITVDGSSSVNSLGNTTGLTYAWSAANGGVISGSSTGSTITATAAGDYTLTVTQANGCTDQSTVSVAADASLPSAVITGNVTLDCNVTSIVLDGSSSTGGTLTYEWQDASNTPLGTNTTYTVSSPGTYNLEVTNTANSCTNTTSVIVVQDITAPTVSIATPVTVDCTNPIILLDGSASDQGSNYNYTWSNAGSGVVLGSGLADTDSTSTADTYTLTVLNTTNGCSASSDVTVVVDTVSPVSNAGADQILTCSVTTVDLDGSASSGTGITYSWTGPGVTNGANTSLATVNQSGNYVLTVTGSNGCIATDTASVTPDANLPVADAGIDMVIDCSNPSVTLDGSNSDSGTNITYSWATSDGNITSPTNTNTATVDLNGTYTLTVTNTSNGCSANDNVLVTMDTISPVADAGSSTAQTITCSSLSVSLDASASTGTGLSYSWTTTNGNIVSGATTSSPDVDQAGDYVVEVMGANGCTNTDTITIAIDTTSPNVSAVSGGDLSCNVTSVNLDGSASTGSNISYSWATTNGNIVSGANTAVATIDAAGDYTLIVASDNGCTDTVSLTVGQTPLPVADFDASPDNGGMPLDVTFTNNSTGGGLTYSWIFGDGNTDTTSNPSNTYENWGDYTAELIVTDSAGCTNTYSVDITVTGVSDLIVPNIFSPNNDGVNDVFNLKGTNITEVSGNIMNRWGQMMYEWDALQAGWDGRTLAGEEASEGVYYYFISAKGADGKEYKFEGTFELVR